MFGKGSQKGAKRESASSSFWLNFGTHFPSKTNPKSMQNSTLKKSWHLMKSQCKFVPDFRPFSNCTSTKKLVFRKSSIHVNHCIYAVECVSPRVRWKRRQSKKREKSIKNQCKFVARKRDAKNMKSAPKWSQNGSQNRWKAGQKRGPKIDAKKGRDYATAWVGRRGGRDAPSNVLNISRRLVFVI